MLGSLPPRTALRELVGRSLWYQLAFVAAVLGAALDAWLSPVVIGNHPHTGELNPVSAYHVLDAGAFASVRILAVVGVTILVALVVRREGSDGWSHGAMALIASVNYVNGTLALSSGIVALRAAEIEYGHFVGHSLLAAAGTLLASWLLLTQFATSPSRRAAALSDRILPSRLSRLAFGSRD